jgi:hypothetical protein
MRTTDREISASNSERFSRGGLCGWTLVAVMRRVMGPGFASESSAGGTDAHYSAIAIAAIPIAAMAISAIAIAAIAVAAIPVARQGKLHRRPKVNPWQKTISLKL